MKKFLGMLLVAALLVSLALGVSAEGIKANKAYTVAFSLKTVTNDAFQQAIADAIEKEVTEAGCKFQLVTAGSETGVATQVTQIEDLITAGVDALVVNPMDANAVIPALQKAKEKGIPVVLVDSSIEEGHEDLYVTYIGTDNYAAGKMAASAALQSGESQICVGLVNYDANSANGQEREKGVREILEQLDNVEIVQAMNVFSIAENARIRTEAMLKQHPEINVIIAFNEPTSVGAARAVRDLGLEEDVWLVGFDSNVETVDLLQSGVVDVLIVQNPYAMGYLGVESAYKLLTGQESSVEKTNITATRTITRENMFAMDKQKALFPFG